MWEIIIEKKNWLEDMNEVLHDLEMIQWKQWKLQKNEEKGIRKYKR